jgi:hypothetical protein
VRYRRIVRKIDPDRTQKWPRYSGSGRFSVPEHMIGRRRDLSSRPPHSASSQVNPKWRLPYQVPAFVGPVNIGLAELTAHRAWGAAGMGVLLAGFALGAGPPRLRCTGCASAMVPWPAARADRGLAAGQISATEPVKPSADREPITE